MTERTASLSDNDVFEHLRKAQERYEEYLKLPTLEANETPMPTYTTANPVGLVVDAIVD